MDDRVVAYVDESVRLTAEPPVYLMAATVLISNDGLAPFEALLPSGASKLHWRDMTDRLRKRSVEAIARTEYLTTVVAAAPLNSRRQVRARERCLQTLLPAIEQLGASLAILESMNNTRSDARDIEVAERLRTAGTIDALRILHAGVEEHGLWLPDQVLGAYGDSLCGSRGSNLWADDWRLVLPSLEIIEVGL